MRQIAGKAWHKWGRGVCDFRKYHAKRVVEGTVLREIFSQCKSVLRTRGKFTFKIGITSEVSTRWLSYTEDAKWIPDVMFLLVQTDSRSAAAYLEAILILWATDSEYSEICRNVENGDKGGEGKFHKLLEPWWVYLAVRTECE